MRRAFDSWSLRGSVLLLLVCMAPATRAAEVLPSWNDGPSKRAIVKFVTDVSTTGSPTFIPLADRIAVFDNDGTLWAEQPIYFQFAFALERVKALAPKHQEWKDQAPFASILPRPGRPAPLRGTGLFVQALFAFQRRTAYASSRTIRSGAGSTTSSGASSPGRAESASRMLISGHRTRAVFERYNVVDTQDLRAAVRALESLGNGWKDQSPGVTLDGASGFRVAGAALFGLPQTTLFARW
jgi:hypothetical protein